MLNNKKKGFTLVELLVVIAILIILGAVSFVGYTTLTTQRIENAAINKLTGYKSYALGSLKDGTETIKVGGQEVTFNFNGSRVLSVEGNPSEATLNAALADLMGATKGTVKINKALTEVTLDNKDAVAKWTVKTDKIEIVK